MNLILTEKIDAACQVAEALHNLDYKGTDLDKKWERIKKTSCKKGYLDCGDYLIVWTNGHLGVDLKPFEINPKYGFKFTHDKEYDYEMPTLLGDMKRVVKSDKKKINKIIKGLIKKNNFDIVYICTDGDAEGERIARDALFLFGGLSEKADVRRMWVTGAFSTPKTIKNELKNGLHYNSEKYKNLADSQYVRANGDYLQGMIPTKTLVDSYGLKLYSGRVKNTIVGLIGDRQLEIKNFTPKPYFVINGIIGDLALNHFYMKDVEDVDKNGKIVVKNERTTFYFKEDSKNKTLADLDEVNLTGLVTKVDTKTSSSAVRPLPLSGDDFKSEMFKKYKTSLSDSGDILQYLRDEGFTTYQGTNGRFFGLDDVDIAKGAYKTAMKVFKDDGNIQSADFTTDAYCFDDKKAKKQNHPPLHLTDKVPGEKDFEKWEKSKLKNIRDGYELIAKRILVHFLENDKYSTTKIEVDINSHLFDKTGVKPIVQGWRNFIGELKANTFFNVDYSVGDKIKLDSYKVQEKSTTKPKLYNEADILSILMNVSKVLNSQLEEETDPTRKLELKKAKAILSDVEGIGTERTREIILKELFKGLVKKGKTLTLSDDGWVLYNALPKELRSVLFTASWEANFEEIRRGEKTYNEVIDMIQENICKSVNHILSNVDETKVKKFAPKAQWVDLDLICPVCKATIQESDNVFKCSKNKYANGKQSGCKFIFIKNQKLLEVKFAKKHFIRLLDGDTLTAPNGNSIELDLENKKYFTKVNFAKKESEPDVLEETPKTYRLNGKFCFKLAFGKKLTKKEATAVLSGEEVDLVRKSKKGKEYEVTVWLNDDEKGGFGSNFDS